MGEGGRGGVSGEKEKGRQHSSAPHIATTTGHSCARVLYRRRDEHNTLCCLLFSFSFVFVFFLFPPFPQLFCELSAYAFAFVHTRGGEGLAMLSDRFIGSVLLVVNTVFILYYMLWIGFMPFVDRNHFTQEFFPPREYGLLLAALIMTTGLGLSITLASVHTILRTGYHPDSGDSALPSPSALAVEGGAGLGNAQTLPGKRFENGGEEAGEVDDGEEGEVTHRTSNAGGGYGLRGGGTAWSPRPAVVQQK